MYRVVWEAMRDQLRLPQQRGAVTIATNTLNGQAAAGNQTGRFALDTATVDDFF